MSVSVPFNAGRGLMRRLRQGASRIDHLVSVPFNAGRGLMRVKPTPPTRQRSVSVPFNAGRGLMQDSDKVPDVLTMWFQYPSMRVVD